MFCASIIRGQSFEYKPDDTFKSSIFHLEFGVGLYSPLNFEYLSSFVTLPQNKSIEWMTIIFVSWYDTIYSDKNYDFYPNVSFFYKFHWKNNGFRFGYSSNSLSYKSIVDSTYWNTSISGWFRMYSGNYQMHKFSIGYEKNYSFKRFDLYYGLDFAYYWGAIVGSSLLGFGNPDNLYSRKYDYIYNIKLNEYSIAPTLGIRYHFWKIFAISSEANLNLLYISAKDTEGHYPSSSRFKVYTNPISSFALSLYF